MSNSKKSFGEVISQVQVMSAGLKNNAEEVAKRGISTEFVTALEKERAEAIALNDEQEKAKAELKVKTDALNAKMNSIEAKMSEAKKVVKLALPKAQWIEFGISDKK